MLFWERLFQKKTFSILFDTIYIVFKQTCHMLLFIVFIWYYYENEFDIGWNTLVMIMCDAIAYIDVR